MKLLEGVWGSVRPDWRGGVIGGLLLALVTTGAGPRKPTPRIQVREVAPDVFMYTSYRVQAGAPAPLPANGLLVRTSQGAVLVDTGWDTDQTLQLLRWVADSLHQRVRLAIVTHAHQDRVGGIAALRANHVRVLGSKLTAQRARAQQLDAPTPAIQPYTVVRAGHTRLELFFPGPGHTPDNIVVWLPRQRVLFGGGLVREKAATGPGPLDDANLKQWPATVRALAARYPKTRVVVPGTGAPGGPELLTHTLNVLRPRML